MLGQAQRQEVADGLLRAAKHARSPLNRWTHNPMSPLRAADCIVAEHHHWPASVEERVGRYQPCLAQCSSTSGSGFHP